MRKTINPVSLTTGKWYVLTLHTGVAGQSFRARYEGFGDRVHQFLEGFTMRFIANLGNYEISPA